MISSQEVEPQPSIGACVRTIAGLDVGGTKTACVEGAFDGTILQRIELPTRATAPFAQTFPEIRASLQQLINTASLAGRTITALSVSVGGPLKIEEGLLLSPPHLPGWHNVNLKRALQGAFPSLPVYVEHDGNAGALAELFFGVGENRPGLQHLIFLTFGTGIGAGIVVNGHILHGASDTAGEIGHWRLAQDGQLAYGKRGSWESFASGSGLVHLAAEMYPARWNPQTSIRVLVDAMVRFDEDAMRVATVAGEYLGRGLALLIDAFNPQVIVLGALACVLQERILAPARQVVAEEALSQANAACEILPSVLGNRIGDVASLMAAITQPSAQLAMKGISK